MAETMTKYLVVIADHVDDDGTDTLRIQLDGPDDDPPDSDVLDIASATAAARGYIGPLTLTVFSGLTEAEAQRLYDALPGERHTDAEIDQLVKLLGPTAKNVRHIHD